MNQSVAAAQDRPSRASRVVGLLLRLVPAAILGQIVFFKLSAAPESVALFEKLGAEPGGRIVTGVLELIAVALLLWPKRAVWGGLLTVGLMAGAIGAYFTRLGIVVGDDGGALFAMALVAFWCGALVVWTRRSDLPRAAGGC